MIRLPQAKPHDPKCSCVTGHYECWHCRKPKLEAIERRLTPAQREYDRLALAGWPKDEDDYREADCCSCHINAPCSYCENHCAECSEHVDDCGCVDDEQTPPSAAQAVAKVREVTEAEAIKRLLAGDRITFSMDGEEAWFTDGDRAHCSDVVQSLRSKGYLRRVVDMDCERGFCWDEASPALPAISEDSHE
ncbi:hypothetical protein [Sulfitobacter sp. 1A13679]|uniref:hypothetical protein n=1 Tax=Sulfitobacter sp. 1A13679 TaxID=3368597 RepID=UPI00374516C8